MLQVADQTGETNDDGVEITEVGFWAVAEATGIPTVEYVEIIDGTSTLPDVVDELEHCVKAKIF